jgi:hypothetical protein
LSGPRIDSPGRGFGDRDERGVSTDLIPLRSNPSTSDVQEGQGLSQFGPYMNEQSNSVFWSANSSENFTRFPTFPSVAHWKT